MQIHALPDSKSNRRSFLRTAGLGLGALGFGRQAAFAAGEPSASFAKPSKIRLGTVTYNLAKDPRMFPAPQRFDMNRPVDPRARHLWYGSGPHFCLGFVLAQRELCAVVDALLRAPGRLRVVRRRYARRVLLPGYARLDVRALPI